MKLIIDNRVSCEEAQKIGEKLAAATGFSMEEIRAAISQLSGITKQPPLPTAEDLAKIGERISFQEVKPKDKKQNINPASRKFKNGRLQR